MLGLYLALLGFGSVLIAISLLFGGGDKDFDKSFDKDFDKDLSADAVVDHDHDHDHDADHDHDHDADHDHDGEGPFGPEAAHDASVGHGAGGSELWTPFLSMRFWTFATMSIGLAGTLLTLAGIPHLAVHAASLLVGLLIGVAAARFFRALKKDTVTATTSLHAYTGEEARVLLAVRAGGQGKVVVESLAGRVELPARTRDDEDIPFGATVIVAAVRDGVADVSRLDSPRAEKVRRAIAARRASREGT